MFFDIGSVLSHSMKYSNDFICVAGVSGGSIINILASQLAGNPNVQWAKWKVFFCDERLTPFSNSDSTYGQFKVRILNHYVDKLF